MCFPSIIPPPLLPLTRHYIANLLYVTMTSLSLPLQMSTRQYATMRQMKAPAAEAVERLASGSAVVVFSVSTCCMCHAVKRLFFGIGVSPTVVELDKDARGRDMERVLSGLLGGATAALPAVFIGGRLLGGMDRVMASHINGTLVNLLRDAGALWL